MRTVTASRIYPASLTEDQFVIEDIAHSLARQCRFTGHVYNHYSVAQHCCIVHDNVQERIRPHALLHDAHEAYLGDPAAPVLKAFPEFRKAYKEAAKAFDRIIFSKWEVELYPEIVELTDQQVLMTEARDICHALDTLDWGYEVGPLRQRIIPWDFRRARGEFLDRFHRLKEKE